MEHPDYYMEEGCGIYALAVARKHPDAEIYILSRNDGEAWSSSIPYEITHVFTRVPGVGDVDVKGVRSTDAMAADFDADGYSLKGPFTPQEFYSRFMGNSDNKPLFGTNKDIKEVEITKTALEVEEIPFNKKRRRGGGYTELVLIDATKFKALWESQHPDEKLNWSPARMERLEPLDAVDDYPKVYVDSLGRVDVSDGRHRITTAANRGVPIWCATRPGMNWPEGMCLQTKKGDGPTQDQSWKPGATVDLLGYRPMHSHEWLPLPDQMAQITKTAGYTAYVLTNEARAAVLKAFPPKFPDVVAHHVTLRLGTNEPLPAPARVVVEGYAADSGVEALVVSVDGATTRPDGEIYHVTLSLDKAQGRSPKDSKAVCQAGWTPVETPFEIQTMPQKVASSPSFNAWFSGSKVVEKTSSTQPPTYHGTSPAAVSAIMKEGLKATPLAGPTGENNPVYSTENRDVAIGYAVDAIINRNPKLSRNIEALKDSKIAIVTIAPGAMQHESPSKQDGRIYTNPAPIPPDQLSVEIVRVGDVCNVSDYEGYACISKKASSFHQTFPVKTAKAVADSPQFKAWFSGSKVVNSDGSPMVMYHATQSDFGEFRPYSHFGTQGAANDRHKNLTEFYTDAVNNPKRTEGFNIMPVYLSIKNPLRMPDLASLDEEGTPLDQYDEAEDMDEEERPFARAWEGEEAVAMTLLEMGIFDIDEFEAARDNEDAYKILETKGYDGIVYKNVVEDAGNDSWIVFHPNQVKSAIGNSGSYNPNNHNITAKIAVKPSTVAPDIILYRGEGPGTTRNGRFWSPEANFAKQFTRQGLESELLIARLPASEIYRATNLPYGGDFDVVDAVAEIAKAKGYTAVWCSEGGSEPNSVYVFDSSKLHWLRRRKYSTRTAKCLTPDAMYHFDITDKSLEAEVDFPEPLNLTEESAEVLENRTHDALEGALAPFWNDKPTAVIIMGDPNLVEDNKRAEDFYEELGSFLEKLGFEVSFDAGEPYTEPKSADLWIGHSRGADRLRFAPKGTATIGINVPQSEEKAEYPIINNPKDTLSKRKFDHGKLVRGSWTDAHYTLTDEMKEQLLKVISDDGLLRGDKTAATVGPVYHGTSKDFKEFELTKGTRTFFGLAQIEVKSGAFFFTGDPAKARSWAENRRDNREPLFVWECNLTMNQTLDLTKPDWPEAEVPHVLLPFEGVPREAGPQGSGELLSVLRDMTEGELNESDWHEMGININQLEVFNPEWLFLMIDSPEIVAALKHLKYDSVIMDEGEDPELGGVSYAVFNKNQINVIKRKKVGSQQKVRAYHGTTKQFDTFDTPAMFHIKRKYCEDLIAGQPDGRIIEAILTIKNPANLDTLHISPSDPKFKELAKSLEERGYDGAQYKNEAWIAFKPEQIQIINSKTAAEVAIQEPEIKRDAPAVEEPQERQVPKSTPPALLPEPQQQQAQPTQPKAPAKPRAKKPKPFIYVPPEENKKFLSWFGRSKVKGYDDEPLVVYHGTTHEFDVFKDDKGNPENFYGKGHYFTSSREDTENYAGMGPDLTNRIEREAENLSYKWDSYEDVDSDIEINIPGWDDMDDEEKAETWDGLTDDDKMDIAKAHAKKRIAGEHGGAVMPCYLRIVKPVIVARRGGTYFDIHYNRDGDPAGKLFDAVERTLMYTGTDPYKFWYDVASDNPDGFTAYEFEVAVRHSETMMNDDVLNEGGPGPIIAAIYREMGFDGIIMENPKDEFSNMKMDDDTRHYIVWNANQIKSALGNSGKFDKKNPVITAGKTAMPNYDYSKYNDREKALKALKFEVERTGNKLLFTADEPEDDARALVKQGSTSPEVSEWFRKMVELRRQFHDDTVRPSREAEAQAIRELGTAATPERVAQRVYELLGNKGRIDDALYTQMDEPDTGKQVEQFGKPLSELEREAKFEDWARQKGITIPEFPKTAKTASSVFLEAAEDARNKVFGAGRARNGDCEPTADALYDILIAEGYDASIAYGFYGNAPHSWVQVGNTYIDATHDQFGDPDIRIGSITDSDFKQDYEVNGLRTYPKTAAKYEGRYALYVEVPKEFRAQFLSEVK